ncbi:prenyltransferase [Companilactobacillus musae]|uniref:prenyltransferase n=1 Tax=Companilactobacillus musae TaxID=1903258 RepID=UPI000E659488|nr:prenyltransferase [Companilactobacillus musae]
MKGIKEFFILTQIYSVVTSAMPALLGMMFVGLYYKQFDLGLSILLFVAVVLFHLAVNVHNQYVDYNKYKSQPDVFKNSVNNTLKVNQIAPVKAVRLTIVLTLISALIGLYLVFKTGIFVLIVGIISFLIGYLYSGGFKSISYSPFGELVSGLTMGYNITLLSVYVNLENTPAFEWNFILKTALVSLVAVFAISNIMLANNISDEKEDLKVGRKTLVAYIGRQKSLLVWIISYALGYLAVILSVLLGYLPVYSLLILVVTLPLVVINSIKFIKKPSKVLTFVNSVKNAQILLVSVIIGGIISLI